MVRRTLLVTVSFLCFSCSQSEPSRNVQVAFPEELKWVSAKADIVAHLTTGPAECLSVPDVIGDIDRLNLGRIAFRSPYLLGGQATRQGLSCQSCHTNGDINRDFFIEGLSAEPGTADVTSFHFSSTLGDDIFNPKPIPSLNSLSGINTSEALKEREEFILRLVEKEFDGVAPTREIKDAVVAYVNALDADQCSSSKWNGKDLLHHQLRIIAQGIELLGMEASFVRPALRNELGRLSSRFPENERLTQKMVDLSSTIKVSDLTDIDEISADWRRIRSEFEKRFGQSYYNQTYVLTKYAPNQ